MAKHIQNDVLAKPINTYRPQIVATAGDEPSEERLGTSLVVSPGRLDHGSYTLIDFHHSAVEFGTVATRSFV